ncbi:MAG: hypothetical protein AB1420_10790 [Bacillota bacterium]
MFIHTKQKLVIAVILALILLLSNITMVTAHEFEKKIFDNKIQLSGYGYSPNWDIGIKKLNELVTEIDYTFDEDHLIGRISIPINGDDLTIDFKMRQDIDNPNLFYGTSEVLLNNKKEFVDLVIELNNNRIEKLYVIIGHLVAFNIGNTISFEELEIKNKAAKAGKEETLGVLSSSDTAIIGQKSSNYLYTHTSIKTNLSTGQEGWLGTRVFTNNTQLLTKITRVKINGTKSGSNWDLLYVRPAGTSSSSQSIVQYMFYWLFARYLSINVTIEGYNGACTASTWEHTYNMWSDWNYHRYSGDGEDNGIVSDVRLEKLGSGTLSGSINIDVTRWSSADGFYYHSLNYNYSL